MKQLITILPIFLFVLCTTKSAVIQKQQDTTTIDSPKAKNVIFLIGDGMGLGQITAGMYANGNKTHLEEFPVVGLHKSYADDKLITDSAAGATAFACGKKTYNGAISVDRDTVPILTLLEEAESKGLSSGLVASSSIVHATPACFIAHNKYRKNYEEIALDFLTTEVDYFVGGGLRFFSNREMDDRNLVKELQKKGYKVEDYVNTDIHEISIDSTKNYVYFTADKEPLPALQGRDYLVDASKNAFPFLDQHGDNGFFIMIEGSQIDWGGHANNTEYIISEFLEYDQVIGDALAFAKADGETLIVVTADHETGGFAIQKESRMDSIAGAFTSDYHTGTMIPVFAYGPGSEAFSGIYENTEIYFKIREALGWNEGIPSNALR